MDFRNTVETWKRKGDAVVSKGLGSILIGPDKATGVSKMRIGDGLGNDSWLLTSWHTTASALAHQEGGLRRCSYAA